MKNYFKDELLRGSFILVILLGIFNLLNYIFQMSMARMLSLEDYGILAVLMSIVYIFGIPAEAIQTVISKYTSKFNSKKEFGRMKDLFIKSIKKCFVFLFGFYILFLILSIFMSDFLKISFWLFAVTGIVLFGSFIVPIIRGVLQGRKKFLAMGSSLVFESAFKIIISVLLVFAGLRVYGGMFGVIFGIFFAFAISFLFVKEILSAKRSNENFEGIFKYSLPSIIAICSIVLMYSLDIILARRFFSAELAGQYAFISLIGKAIVFANSAIGKAMFPISSESHEKGNKTSGLLKKSIFFVGIISFLALLFYFFFPEFVVKVLSLGSDKYLPAANILFLVGLSFAFTSIINIIILYKLSTNNLKHPVILLIFPIIEIILLTIFNSSLMVFTSALVFSNFLMLIYSFWLIKK